MVSKKIKELQDIANILRRDSLKATSSAGSGHPSSCLSSAEIISVLFFNEMNYDTKNPGNNDNDEFILSKGHAAPIFYSALYRAKAINYDLNTLRRLNSPLEGHQMPRSLRWAKIATGSLGQGLSAGLGMAIASKLQKKRYMTYVLLGDSEFAEGSIYEALQLAGHYSLNSLVAIIDVNRLGQRGETMLGHKVKEYTQRIKSFGWQAIIVNGHDINQIISAFNKARKSHQPTAIIAKTLKGKGVSFIENKEGWHGRSLTEWELQQALKEIPDPEMPPVIIKEAKAHPHEFKISKYKSDYYKLGDEIATRKAYGKALANLAKSNSSILALDAEVSNSTYSNEVKESRPGQFIETFIQEQNMIGISLGLSKKGFNVFASTFAAFLSRCHDQIRMAALSNASFTINGSQAGVSIGEDGASQMGLEDIAMFRSLPNSIVFYPSDAVSTEKLVSLASKLKGIKYIRTSRPNSPVIYNSNENFRIGDFKVLKQSKNDKAVLIGSGITLHESLKAHDFLKQKGKRTAVLDLYCIKPFNSKKLINFVKQHGNNIIVTEDHYKEGGIGEMLASQLNNSGIKIRSLAIEKIPHSGKKDELLNLYGINWRAIVEAVKSTDS